MDRHRRFQVIRDYAYRENFDLTAVKFGKRHLGDVLGSYKLRQSAHRGVLDSNQNLIHLVLD